MHKLIGTLSSNNFYARFKSYNQSNNSSLFHNLIMPNSAFYEYVFSVDNIFNNNFIQLATRLNVDACLIEANARNDTGGR